MYGAFDILYLALFTAAVIKTPQNIVKICNISFYELFAVFIEWQNLYSILYIMDSDQECYVFYLSILSACVKSMASKYIHTYILYLNSSLPRALPPSILTTKLHEYILIC